MYKLKENKKGITLIALVVTIIVLLILAGVAITLTVGDNGLFNRAKQAREESEKAQLKEELEQIITEMEVDKAMQGGILTKEEIANRLGEISEVIYNTEKIIEGEYKDYEYIVDEENKVTIGKKLEGESPTVEITILDKEENLDKTRIQVIGSKIEIESIELIKGVAVGTTENSSGDKIFEVTENGIYTFKVAGVNGRKTIKSITVNNLVNKSNLKEELEKIIKEVIEEKGENATKHDIAEKLKEVATIIYDTEDKIEGEYKGYGFIVDEDNNVTIGERLTGERPEITITILDTEDDQESVRIQVTSTLAEEEITSIESADGYSPTEENGKADKIFTVTKNGEYTFKITGTNGRIGAKKVKVTNIIEIIEAESIFDGISKVKTAGTKKIKVAGKTSGGASENITYLMNVIYYDRNLTLGTDASVGVEGNLELNGTTWSCGNSKDVATGISNTSQMAKKGVVLKVEGDLTIENNYTLTAKGGTYGGPKGMIVYCTGTLTNNGTMSMKSRGAYAEGENVYLLKQTDGSFKYVPATGGAGAERRSSEGNNAGGKSTNWACGGRRKWPLWRRRSWRLGNLVWRRRTRNIVCWRSVDGGAKAYGYTPAAQSARGPLFGLRGYPENSAESRSRYRKQWNKWTSNSSIKQN